MPHLATSSASSHIQRGSLDIISRVPVTSWNSERVKPGHSAVTCTPRSAFSSDSASLNFTIQALAGAYRVCPSAAGTSAANEDTLRMRPSPKLRIEGSRRQVSSLAAPTITCRKRAWVSQSLRR